MPIELNAEFWNGKRVLLTGHTGFKGAWAAKILRRLGAEVTGVSLEPDDDLSLFTLLAPWDDIDSHILDIRDADALATLVKTAQPQVVIHMAAQALVRKSYVEPVDTVTTNVVGTMNLLQALRDVACLQCALVITSDKVYRNDDSGTAFTEDAPLGGDDPYSASKAAAEMITWSWAKSFFADTDALIATARAGNVLGGGDFAEDRLVPDIWRATQAGRDLVLRYPQATRPWQHVLDLTLGYLGYVQALIGGARGDIPPAMNFGPAQGESMTVEAIARCVMDAFGASASIKIEPATLGEKTALSIDASQAGRTLDWQARLNMQDTALWTTEWYKRFSEGEAPGTITEDQIGRYLNR